MRSRCSISREYSTWILSPGRTGRRNFKDLWYNEDRPSYQVARDMLAGHGEWLEQGVLKP